MNSSSRSRTLMLVALCGLTGTVDAASKLPNLKPFTPDGWVAPVQVKVNESQQVWVDWAVSNAGKRAAVQDFKVHLVLNNATVATTTLKGLKSGQSENRQRVELKGTPPRVGQNNLALVIDAANAVGESNESDNVYIASFTVAANTTTSTKLQFPLPGPNARDAEISSMLDLDTGRGRIALTDGSSVDLATAGVKAYLYQGFSNSASPITPEEAQGIYLKDTVKYQVGYATADKRSFKFKGLNYRDRASYPVGHGLPANGIVWYDNHRGYDYPAVQGTPVAAVYAGTIVQSGSKVASGTSAVFTECNTVRLKLDPPYADVEVYYLHMGSTPKLGRVKRGDVIGSVGSACTKSFHLHLGMYKAGQLVCPYANKWWE